MLAVLTKATIVPKKDEVRVVAVRINRGDAGDKLLNGMSRGETGDKLLDFKKLLDIPEFLVLFERWYDQDEKLSAFGPRLNFEHGMILHDPDRPVFEPDIATTPMRRVWFDAVVESLGPLLPELVVSILEHADNEIVPQFLPFKGCTSRAAKFKRQVFLLFYETTQEEALRTRSIPQAAGNKFLEEISYDTRYRDRGFDVEIVPLQSHGIRTRRDMVNFWNYYRDPEQHYLSPRVAFVFKRIIDDDIETAQFGLACTDFRRPTVIMRTSLNAIIAYNSIYADYLSSFMSNHRFHSRLRMENVESMYHPEQPFWYNPPLWMPASDGSYSSVAISLFQLTQEVTEGEIETIKKDLISDVKQDEPQGCRKDVCLVPWRRSRDATMDDIWRTIWEFWKVQGMKMSGGRMICVDRQSAEDRTVLVAVPGWYPYERRMVRYGFRFYEVEHALKGVPCPWIRGIFYFRVAASKARSFPYDPSTRGRGDVAPEFEGRFRRPDWPAPGNLPKEDEIVSGIDVDDYEYLDWEPRFI